MKEGEHHEALLVASLVCFLLGLFSPLMGISAETSLVQAILSLPQDRALLYVAVPFASSLFFGLLSLPVSFIMGVRASWVVQSLMKTDVSAVSAASDAWVSAVIAGILTLFGVWVGVEFSRGRGMDWRKLVAFLLVYLVSCWWGCGYLPAN